MSKKKRKKRTQSKNDTQAKSQRKKISLIILRVLMVVGGIFFYDLTNNSNGPETSKVQQAVAQADPSFLRGGEDRPVLPPARFTGKVARAYHIAEQYPVLLDSMYCYCNCKKTFGHKSLLSCYVDTHAVSCGICQDQAFFAVAKHLDGKDIIEVRKLVDKKFWRPLS